MRVHRQIFAGIIVGLCTLVGCAPTQQAASNSQLWPWKQNPSAAASHLLEHELAGLPAGALGPALPPATAVSAAPAFDFSHPRVERYVKRFQSDLRRFYESAFERSGKYVPQMTEIFQEYGLPTGLVYLPLIESGFRNGAVSHAGAVGPWQFIRGTGRHYGLRIDRYVDERRDPVKATHAAAQYLKNLHDMFGDWQLALAGYNTGEANVGRALKRGNASTYWEIMERGLIHRETREYVPRFLAALQIAEMPEAYGFDAPPAEFPEYDWVHIPQAIGLWKVAEMSGTATKTLRTLNPALVRGSVPSGGYDIRLPKGTKKAFEIAWNSQAHKVASRPAPKVNKAPKTYHATAKKGQLTHRVRKGDTPGRIAKRYGVSVKALLRENSGVNPRTLQVGDRLAIPAGGRQVATHEARPRTHSVRRGQTAASIAKQYGVTAKALLRANGIANPRGIQIGQSLKIPSGKVASAQTHKVQRGETIASIAKLHNVSARALMKANHIRNPRSLQPGQKLVLPGIG